MVYLPLIYSLGYPLITSSPYPMSNPDYPRFLHVPKGAMEQVAAGRSRKKPGPKKRQFSTPRTPKKTSNLSQDLMTESPTPSSNTVSSFDPPRESRAVYPPAPPPLPMPTIEPPTYLSQPDLFAPAIPPLSQSIIWTDGGVRNDRFLHSTVEHEEETYTDLLVPLRPEFDFATPGLILVDGFLRNTNLPDRDQYTQSEIQLDQLPIHFDGLVSTSPLSFPFCLLIFSSTTTRFAVQSVRRR
jgi:hypothetical protein